MLENASDDLTNNSQVPPHGPCGAVGAGQPWASTIRFRDPLEKEPLGRGKWVFRGLHAASALPFRLLVCYARAKRLAPGSHGTERPWWWRSVGYGAVGASGKCGFGVLCMLSRCFVFSVYLCGMCVALALWVGALYSDLPQSSDGDCDAVPSLVCTWTARTITCGCSVQSV